MMPETYGNYTMMGSRRAGQYWSANKAAGQWAWSPQPDGSSRISWGDPAHWPPAYAEHFHHDESWAYVDGWDDNGTYYTQRVTQEQIGDVNGRNLVNLPLAPDRREHYAKWNIPTQGYTLKSWGRITEGLSGKIVDFGHTQIWYPPADMANSYLGTKRAVRCWEAWWDNNGAPGQPITRKLERAVAYALGVGPAWVIEQYYPTAWRATLRYTWAW